ncbi:DNA-binding transcriptional regulator, LysR family [Arboricoccus pini]|uniref:DNA-binding transcriptional regulator, LysR family n=1 Tax=Arboricoccus pini TaxID=1963835 RepID=A0A212RXU7_9PROT|nr:LysR family transcriptional regulator [Arboricoccus pini]SNB77628.1 DNA-binding transcriptional regulator, LysR family [Arboricoccus pini]
MELNWLEDFLALAQTRNFSRAAEARHVTQPAFSRRIRALEAWVGTQLVERSGHGVALNAAGEYLRAQAADITRDLYQARRATLKVAGRERTALAIAATHALSFTFFPSWIRAWAPLDRLGSVNLVSDTMAACERILAAGEVDFLLCHYHQATPPLVEQTRFRSVVVGHDVLVPVMAPSDAAGPDLPGTANRPVRYLAYSSASGLGRILETAGRVSSPWLFLDKVFTSPLAAALLTMARQGNGVAWLPRSLAAEDLAVGSLVLAGGSEFAVPVDICLFCAPELKSATARSFWQTVTQDMGAREA